MNETLIKLLFALALAVPFGLLLIKYILLSISFMTNENIDWDKHVEKPRLLFYIVFGGLSYLCWYLIHNIPFEGTANSKLVFQIFMLLCVAFYSFMLHFTWTKRFRKKYIKDNNSKSDISRIEPISKDINELTSVYKSITSNKLISGKLETFIALTEKNQIPKQDRFRWLDVIPTNKTKSNKQSLIEFLVTLFPKLDFEDNKTIIDLMERYFTDLNGNELFEGTKNKSRIVSHWKKNKSGYLQNMDILPETNIIDT